MFLTLKPNFDGGKVKKTKQTTTTTYEAMSICICEHMCVLKKKKVPNASQRAETSMSRIRVLFFFLGESAPPLCLHTGQQHPEACECIHGKKQNKT